MLCFQGKNVTTCMQNNPILLDNTLYVVKSDEWSINKRSLLFSEVVNSSFRVFLHYVFLENVAKILAKK